MNFKIGEKVVCIHTFARTEDLIHGARHPIKGEMYTIRTINIKEDGTYLRFTELINPVLPYSGGKQINECQYWDERFRKLDYDFANRVIEELLKEPITV